MMIDNKGCFLIWAVPTLIMLSLGLMLRGVGLIKTWEPVIGMALVPTALIALFVFYLFIRWVSDSIGNR